MHSHGCLAGTSLGAELWGEEAVGEINPTPTTSPQTL